MAKRFSYSEAVEKSTPAYLPSIVSSRIGGLFPGAEFYCLISPTLNDEYRSYATS